MCGIAGIIHSVGVDPSTLQGMSRVMKHRGPDDEGFSMHSADADLFLKGDDTIPELQTIPAASQVSRQTAYTLGLLHRRLSILDLSAQGHQPMTYNHGLYTLVFNGEIYNYRELRNELKSAGYTFHTESDTEVIMAAYQRWGHDCVQYFVGMWAFALYDKQKQQLFLSRDRFGIKPLYYATGAGFLAFASEIKALLTLDAVKPEADMNAVLEYLSFGATSDPSANLFHHVKCLPPGHSMVADSHSGTYRQKMYYNLEEAVAACKLPADPEVQQTFNALLDRSVDLHLRADVPVGSTLSGGLDSSTLVALAAHKMKGATFKTFTAAYREKNIDESHYARLVTDSLPNVEAHLAFPDIEGYWNDLGKMIWHQDLPVNSTSMFAQWEVMKTAHQQHVKVLLDGQGADEMLGGYYNFAGIHLIELAKSGKWKTFAHERNRLRENFTPHVNTIMGRAGFYFLPEFAQRRIRSRKRIGMGAIGPAYAQDMQHIKVPERGGRSFREQSLLSIQFGMQDLLRYEDRNSMAFSIESRVPFLDHRLVEFSIALRNNWKIRDGWTKYILRKSAEPLLNKEVVWRKDKMGFLTPQKSWKENSGGQLARFMQDLEIPDFLDKDYIQRLCSANMSESAHLSEFWKIISFLKWASVFHVTFNRNPS
ncbi:MAG: asparagine synthase (glutamine-hydrolyzing) [Bacteroidetes bacterium]|nr:asparagine synthase (glutamine-hydrolyzing) [Bacteroidota bacterium]